MQVWNAMRQTIDADVDPQDTNETVMKLRTSTSLFGRCTSSWPRDRRHADTANLRGRIAAPAGGRST